MQMKRDIEADFLSLINSNEREQETRIQNFAAQSMPGLERIRAWEPENSSGEELKAVVKNYLEPMNFAATRMQLDHDVEYLLYYAVEFPQARSRLQQIVPPDLIPENGKRADIQNGRDHPMVESTRAGVSVR